MTTFPSFQTPGFAGVPNQGIPKAGVSSAFSFRPPPGVGAPGFDADPITPGNQNTPGVVTATGPSRFVSGPPGAIGGPIGAMPGLLPGGMGLPSISTRPGFIPGGVGIGAPGGVVDADPITPGIQAQPGVVTPIGPPRVVSGPTVPLAGGFKTSGIGMGVGYGAVNTTVASRTMISGGQFNSQFGGQFGQFNNIPNGNFIAGSAIGGIAQGGIVDADPITPGIQAQPGIVTPIGPPRVISGPNTIAGINNVLSTGIRRSFAGGVVDADPITPGIQAQPGIVTPVGPPVVVSNQYRTSGIGSSGFIGGNFTAGGAIGGTTFGGGMLSSGAGGMLTSGAINTTSYQTTTINQIPIVPVAPMLSSGVLNSGFRQNVGIVEVIDADPITPGIQLQPGTFTATGSTTMMTSGFGNTIIPGGLIDADPVTPGIQAQPGIVTQTGPTTVVSTGGLGLGSIAGVATLQSRGGIIDADPITPGIQSRPGVITPVGPTMIVGNVNSSNQCCGGLCPWWLWALLGLLLLGALIGGLYGCLRPKQDVLEVEEFNRDITTECSGYLNSNGDCIACPEGSEWNGKTCTYNKFEQNNIQKRTVLAQEGQTPSGNDLPAQIDHTHPSSQESTRSFNKKVAVFAEQQNDQAINGALKAAAVESGVAPTVVVSKPIPSKPTSIIDASNASVSSSSFTSTNVVRVPAITERKSVAPTISYSKRSGDSLSGSSFGASQFSSSSKSSGFIGSAGSKNSNYSSKFSSSSSNSGSNQGSSSASSSGSSSSGNSSGSSSSKTTKIRKITRTITSTRDQAVDAIASPLLYRHLQRHTA